MAKAPSFKRRDKGSNALELLIIRDMLKQKSEGRAEERKVAQERRSVEGLPMQELVKSRRKEEEQKRTQAFNFEKVRSLLKKTVGQAKARFEEQGTLDVPDFGLEGFDVGGPIRGKIGSAAAAMRIPGFERTGTTFGQETETTLALNSILTGQNRVIKGVTAKIAKTLPRDIETPASMREKIAQTVRNSFGLFKSLEQAGFTPEMFDALSDAEASDENSQFNQTILALPFSELDEEEEIAAQQLIDDILGTPAVRPQSESPIPGSPRQGSSDRTSARQRIKDRLKRRLR